MTDLNKKQAFWAEQLPLFKEKYWLPEHLDVLEFNMDGGCFEIPIDVKTDLSEDDLFDIYHRVNSGWAMWKKAVTFMKEKAKAQAVPVWISTDLMKPDDHDYVDILINAERRIVDAVYLDGKFFIFPPFSKEQWTEVNNKVTHWMPRVEVTSESGAEG